MAKDDSRLVYSTSREIPRKDERQSGGMGTSPKPRKVVVRLEKKGRGGKTVTIVEGLGLDAKQQHELLRSLKAALGTGGTVTEGGMELQGDHRDAVMAALGKAGFRPRRSGG
jgi:translation initiation factor 1